MKGNLQKKVSKCCNKSLIHYDNLGDYCENCFSVFTKNLPSDEKLSLYYNKYIDTYHGGGRNSGAKRRQLKYAVKYFEILQSHSKGHNLIDIGSANSPFPNIAYKNGYKVTVVDYAKPVDLNINIKYICSSIENLKVESVQYDIITAFAIIEHTKYPKKALTNIADLAKTNGTIIIYIPEIGRFYDNYALGTTKWYFPPEHLNLLSKKGLEKIMLNVNCELIHYSRFEYNYLRFMVRYGIGFIEGCTGFIVQKISYKYWSKVRKKRKSKYQGMGLFVFKKKNNFL